MKQIVTKYGAIVCVENEKEKQVIHAEIQEERKKSKRQKAKKEIDDFEHDDINQGVM